MPGPRRLAAAALAATVLVGGCRADQARPPTPSGTAFSGAAEHTHAAGADHPVPIGDGSTAVAGGFRLTDVRLGVRPGRPGTVTFRVLDRRGRPVVDYLYEQTRLLHLYLVRTDLTGFRHLHPTLGPDGTWSARLALTEPGDYRVLAEFVPEGTGGRSVALGTVRTVPGRWRPATVPAAGATGTAEDGVLRVRVDGPGEVGRDGRLSLLVGSVGNGPVPLGPYLGTAAHVTGFPARRGDGFVHLHPYAEPAATPDGTRLTFHTRFAKPGPYRLFVQVRVDGFVHTVPVMAQVRRPGTRAR